MWKFRMADIGKPGKNITFAIHAQGKAFNTAAVR